MAAILVCLDTSPGVSRVLEAAATLAGSTRAHVSLLHVIEPVATYVPVGASMDVVATAPQELTDDGLDAARRRLSELAGPLERAGLTVDWEAVVGLAVDEIVERAKSCAADYIVLGSHGHGALFHLFSGSVVTGVLKQSHVPVVVVPVRDS